MKKNQANGGLLTIATVICLLPCLTIETALATQWQPLDTIARTATEYAKAAHAAQGMRLETQVKALDSRLKLTKCGTALQGFVPGNLPVSDNIVVGVKCTSPKPWKVYVPVQIAVYRAVLVANRPLARGHVISPDDVRIDERNVARVRSTYLTDIEQLERMALRRSIPQGTLLTIDHLNAERIVKRGQSVTLVINRGGFEVRMAGTALSDGSVSQRIRVENHSSKRIVEGVVRSPQTVEIVL